MRTGVVVETSVVDGVVTEAVVVGGVGVGEGAGAGRVGIETVFRGWGGRCRVGRRTALLLGHVADGGCRICRRGFRLVVAVVAGIGSGQTLGVVGCAALHGAATCEQDGDGSMAVLLFDSGMGCVVADCGLGCPKTRLMRVVPLVHGLGCFVALVCLRLD